MKFGIRELVFVLLLMGLAIGSYWWPWSQPRYGLKTTYQQTQAMARENDQRQAKLDQLEQALKTVADLGQEIDELSATIEVFEQKLPAAREENVILKQVWELAAKHRLTPKSVRTDKPVVSANYTELPIRMVIIGDFDGFYSFLLDLEKLRRITQLRTMTIRKFNESNSRSNDQQPDGQMQADVVLSIFFEPQSAGGPSI